MLSDDSQFSPLDRRVIKVADRKFPQISSSICADKQGEICDITGEKCELLNCPKLNGEEENGGEESGSEK